MDESTRVYSVEDARGFLSGNGDEINRLADQVDGKFVSGFIRDQTNIRFGQP